MKHNFYEEEDYSLNDLTPSIIDKIRNVEQNWLNSWGFCTEYHYRGAERVFIKKKKDVIYEVIFYRLRKEFGFIKAIEICGFPTASNEDISYLLKKHGAKLAYVNRLENAVKPSDNWKTNNPSIYFKNYITIANLPEEKSMYFEMLGKNHKRNLRRYWRKFMNYFDNDIELECKSGKDISIQEVIELEQLNKNRRLKKGKGVDSDAEIRKRQEYRTALTHEAGLLITFRHQGKIIGGTLSHITTDEAFLFIIAHDVNYEELYIGNLILWKSIEILIEKGIRKYNFLWGRNVYKTRFLGVEYPWCVHVISQYEPISVIWKNWISACEFYIRIRRFTLTRLGLV